MKKNSKILQILPSLESGGVERGVVDLVKEIKNKGFTPFVMSCGGSMTYLLKESKIEHITLDVKTKNPFKIFCNIKKIAKFINENSIDLVHVRSRAPMISSYFACKKTKAKLVSTVHGPYSLKLNSKISKIKIFYNSFMLKTDRVIAVSDFIKNYITENYNSYFKQDLSKKTKVISRGVDLKYFDPDSIFIARSINLSKKWRVDEDKKVILFPARITSWKGHELLLESLQLVKSDFICLFVGSDHGHEKFKQKLQEKIISCNLAQKVRFVGNCKDMPVAYSIANLVISASIKPEAFGRIAIEAQAMKKILIATNIGGSLETVINNKTGFLVEPQNAKKMALTIDKALNLDEEEKEEICNNARKHVEDNFSNQKMYKKVIDLYEEILNV